MRLSKLIFIAVLCLFGAPIVNAGDTTIYTAGGGECIETTKCITLGTDLACAEVGTAVDVTTQCGTGFTCGSLTDANGAKVDVCATT
uniref:CC domain-containing protein n=1 Tax=Strongyloides papillosus TaxID=174720 RepID=A0A0N5BJC4_STREA